MGAGVAIKFIYFHNSAISTIIVSKGNWDGPLVPSTWFICSELLPTHSQYCILEVITLTRQIMVQVMAFTSVVYSMILGKVLGSKPNFWEYSFIIFKKSDGYYNINRIGWERRKLWGSKPNYGEFAFYYYFKNRDWRVSGTEHRKTVEITLKKNFITSCCNIIPKWQKKEFYNIM